MRDWRLAKVWLRRELQPWSARMNAERWNQVEQLYHSAREQEPRRARPFPKSSLRRRRGTAAGSRVAAQL